MSPIKTGSSLSFIVPARNEEKYLRRCLQSIQDQVIDNGQVANITTWVIDNQSTDCTAAIASEHDVQVHTVSPSNAATTRNRGASQVDCDLIAFIDADCVLPNNWLSQCLSHFDDQQVVGVGASQAYSGKNSPWIERVWTDIICPNTTPKNRETNWLPAFNLIVRRDIFDTINGFDESLETCEDSDLTSRMARHGKLILEHSVKVRHLGESHNIREFFQREMWRSRGNFRSAMKRKTVLNEIKSLAIPTAYVLTFLLLLLSPMLVNLNEKLALGLMSLSGVSVIGLPLLIATKKGSIEPLLGRAIVLSIYLLARGIGAFIPVSRVQRKREQ